MIRLSLLSVKGGVGKTTVSYYLARELSRRMKVILVVVGSYNVLAKIFGVEDSLIDGGDFYAEKDGVSFLYFAKRPKTVDVEEVAKVYAHYLDDIDLAIVDVPTHLDHVVSLEYEAFYRAVEAKYFALAISTPNPYVLTSTEKYLQTFCQLYNHKSLGVAINLYRGEEIGKHELVIPFNKELFFKGISSETPKEFKEFADKIFNILSSVN
ncbi:MAG: hypothetical protein K1T65_01710 [Candidatus Aramenus sp.]|nr:hypothetical protein [Candidatus Aramenus sp.]